MKTLLLKLVGGAATGLVITVATARANMFTGEFAPANWTFSGLPADLVWDPAPPANPTPVTVTAPHLANSTTTLQLNPLTSLYLVSFRTTFNAMSAPTASLTMNAPGYVGVSLGVFPGDTQPVINNFSLTMGPGDSIAFALTADTTDIGDKKNVPFFTVDEWNVRIVPEPGQWALMGVTLLGAAGYALRRRSAAKTD